MPSTFTPELTPPLSPPRVRTGSFLLTAALVLGACQAGGPAPVPTGRSFATVTDAAAASEPAAYEPVTIENCGVTTTYEVPPERVVALDVSTLETMLVLGLEDRIEGVVVAHRQAVRPDLEEAASRITELSEGHSPTKEALLAVDPDFILASFESYLAEERGLSRESLAELDVKTHVFNEECVTTSPTWDTLYGEIDVLGRIFGVEERAAEMIAEMQAEVAQAEQIAAAAPEGPAVFVFDSGESAPFTAGGGGMEDLIIDSAGGKHVFAEVEGAFGEVTWEEVVARDPEVIIINDYQDQSGTSTTVESKEDFLKGFPAMAEVSAIRNDRIVSIPLTNTFLSVRNTEAAVDVAELLHGEP